MIRHTSAVIRSGLFCLLLPLSLCLALPAFAGDAEVLFQTGTIDALLAGGLRWYDHLRRTAAARRPGASAPLTGWKARWSSSATRYTRYARTAAYVPCLLQPPLLLPPLLPFQADETLTFTDVTSLKDFYQRLQAKLPGKNLFYSIKITGVFDHIKARSVPQTTEALPAAGRGGQNPVRFSNTPIPKAISSVFTVLNLHKKSMSPDSMSIF